MILANLIRKGTLKGFATATVATPATHDAFSPPTVATVAGVAVAKGPKQPDLAAPHAIDIPALGRALLKQSRAEAAAAEVVATNPDADCWPHSPAMNGSEIDLFAERLVRFTGKGLTTDDAESLADKLVKRDRDKDDRRVCLECANLTGYGRTSWRCSNWRVAGIAIRARDNQLPADLVLQLQRCDGFKLAGSAP